MQSFNQMSSNPFYQGTFPAQTQQNMGQMPPQPMNMALQANAQQSPFPSLYDNMAPNQTNQFGSNTSHPTYAKGGHVDLRQMAERMRKKGQGEDTVLAHIHPLEAMELERKYGSSGINPLTGLPQYGFKLKLPKFIRKALPIVTSIIGSALGGPAGAALGGGLGRAAAGSDKGMFRGKAMKNLASGAITGALVGLGGQALGGMGGGASALGKGAQAGSGGLGSIFGKMGGGGLSSMLGNLGGGANALGKGATGMGGGGLGSMLGSIGSGGLVQNMLLGGALYGALKGKQKATPEPMVPQQYSPPEPLPPPAPMWRPDQEARPYTPRQRVRRAFQHPDPYRAGELPEFEYVESQSPLVNYAGGGPVHIDYIDQEPSMYDHGGRYYEGETGGQDDLINARVSPGEYVLDADLVSSIGDGNNVAGAKKLKAMAMRIRSEKRSAPRSKIPPKTKSLSSYMKRG